MSDFPVSFHRSFPFPCHFFTSDLAFSTQRQKWCYHIQSRTWKTWYRTSRSLVFFKIGALKVLQTSVKHLFFKRLEVWGAAALSKRNSKFAKFLRTPFFTKYLRWLLLVIISVTPLFTLSKQTSRHHFFKTAYYLRFYGPWKYRNTNNEILLGWILRIVVA